MRRIVAGTLIRRLSTTGLLALTAASVAAGAAAAPAASASAVKATASHVRPHVYHIAGHAQAKAARLVNFRRQHQRPTRPKISPSAAFTTAFDGISQGSCATCFPRPSSATSPNGAQILETTGDFMQVFDKAGNTLCDGGLSTDAFLGLPAGTVRGVQVQYDDVNDQFLMTAFNTTATPPTIYVAATTSHDACGSWHVSTMVLTGGTLRPTSDIFSLSAAQDTRALLLSAGGDDTPQHGIGLVLAVPKAAIYAGSPLSAALFEPVSAGIPVTMAGNPMIDSPDSYFLEGDSNGYTLLTMTGSGSADPTLTGVTIAVQGTSFLDTTPVFDGSRIWFAEDFCDTTSGGQCGNVHYGYVTVADDSLTLGHVTVPAGDVAGDAAIAVDPDTDGTVSVFLDWLYTTTNPIHGPQTNLVKSFIYPGGPLPDSGPLDQVTATSDSAVFIGGPFSQATADPGTANGACALTTQVYFRSDDSWTTRVRRKCGPASPLTMPSVVGDTQAAAVSAVQAAGIPVTVTDVTTPGVFCDADTAGTIFEQNPQPGPVSEGVSANLLFCDITTTVVPNVQFDPPAQAVAALQAAGLTEGSVIDTTDCSAGRDGLILATAPAIGTRLPTGTQVSLEECTNTTAIVPDVTGETPGQATTDLQDAGLTAGSTSLTTSCDVPAGTIAKTSPPAGDHEPVGTTVRLFESTGRPATCN